MQPASPSVAAPESRSDGALPPGTLLQGRYRINRVLGSGTFGRVYLADDVKDPGNARVAIKELLATQFASDDERREAITWFKREVSTLLTLEHPGIPSIFGYWTAETADGPLCLVMDYIPGQTLEKVLQDAGGRVPWAQVVTWGIELCEVLSYLHSRMPPFVFRDMKLSNAMLDSRTNTLVLIDFGITRQLAPTGGTAISTWGYVPYEQVLGNTEPRSDLYALGATLHALLTGRHPDAEYTRLRRDGLDVAAAMRALFPPVDALVPAIPSALADVLACATAFAADDRFADAASMASALRQVEHGAHGPAIHGHRGAPPLQPPIRRAPGVAILPPYSSPATAQRLVVSAHGRGQFATIAAALRHAQAGARIEVLPGLYAETLLIDKTVEIIGMGPTEDIIVETANAPGIVMRVDTALVRGLTVRGGLGPTGRHSARSALQASSGKSAGILERIVSRIKAIPAPLMEAFNSFSERRPCHAVDIARGRPVLEDCHITSGSPWCVVAVHGALADPVFRRCSIHDGRDVGILFYDHSRGTMEECPITDNAKAGVAITEGSNPMIRSCIVDGGMGAGRGIVRRI